MKIEYKIEIDEIREAITDWLVKNLKIDKNKIEAIVPHMTEDLYRMHFVAHLDTRKTLAAGKD